MNHQAFFCDFPQLFDGSDNSSAELTPDGGFTGSSAIPNTTFTSTGPVVFALFHSSLVQTAGNFTLDFNLGKGDDIGDTGRSRFALSERNYYGSVFFISRWPYTNSSMC